MNLEEHIKRLVDSAPPPTPEDAARLRALLPPIETEEPRR